MGSVGFKYLGRKAQSFRSDHCRSCDTVVVAKRVRSWIWLTVFWVPVLPLGFQHRWLCKDCENATAAVPRTQRAFKILAFVLLLVAFAGSFAVSPEEPPTVRGVSRDMLTDGGGVPIGLVRAICGISALIAGVWVLRHEPIPSRTLVLKGFEPATFEDCPICGGQLIGTGDPRCCVACGADERFLVLDS